MEQLLAYIDDPLLLAVAVAALASLAIGGGLAASRSRSRRTEEESAASAPGTAVGAPPADVPAAAPIDEATAGEAESATDASPRPESGDVEPAADAVEVAPTGPVAEPQPALDVPESVPSRMTRLRGRLARSGAIGKALLGLLSRGDLSAADWEEIEDTLLVADLGLAATDELTEALRTRVKVEGTTDVSRVRAMLIDELEKIVDPAMDRSLNLAVRDVDGTRVPATILVVGVNGTGKTTTIGKLARVLVSEGKTVLLGAADTFRAAAAEQLGTWGSRVGVDVVAADREGADPASVAFDAVKTGVDREVDVVVVDTAGRLQNKAGLMDELGKVRRVMERTAPVSEVLLVLDATTGQNGMNQAKVFAEVAGVTGIVLTKLDGSAKGGIVVSVQRELGVPVKFVGLGEGVDDLAPFDPRGFVEAIVGE